MKTMFITADPDIAAYVENCGVDVIFVDMEVRGKRERQGHLDTHIASHTLEDVRLLSRTLTRAELMVRVNPLWDGSKEEIDGVVEAGARRIMLPMFRTASEILRFVSIVDCRVPVTLLVETAAALARLPSYLPLLQQSDEIHFGLNDLSIDMGLTFLFEVLAGRLLDGPAALCREAGISFGIGGVGRIGRGAVPAEWVLSEHVRLGSSAVILSRAFRDGASSVEELGNADFPIELSKLHHALAELRRLPSDALIANHGRLVRRVAEYIGN